MIIYGAIAVVGFVILLFMLVVGEIFGGDHEIGGHELDHGDVDHGASPSVFSVRVMSSFITAFGVGGVVGRYYGFSHPGASGVGVVSGIVMAMIVLQFGKFLYSQQASSDVRMTSLIGQSAQVSVAIPKGGVGQITTTAGGERTEHIARSADGQPLVRGADVVITKLSGDAVVVAPPGAAPRGGSR